MNYIRFGLRFLLFSILLTATTVIIEFTISGIYSFLLDYYALPKSDSNITFLSFFISLIFILLLTFGTGFWQLSKSYE